MTYIVAGQINNLNFLMSDCIATDNTKNPPRYTFAEKTKRLLSNPDTFVSLAGVGNVAHYVEFYDYWLYSQGEKSDFINDIDCLKKLVQFILLANERSTFGKQLLNENRLFFLTKEGVFFCHLIFNDDNTLKGEPSITKLENNSYIDSCFSYKIVRIGELKPTITKDNIRDFCMEKMRSLADGDGERADLFERRIQFILLDENREFIVESPFRYPSDILSFYFDKDFKDLDNPEFRFTI